MAVTILLPDPPTPPHMHLYGINFEQAIFDLQPVHHCYMISRSLWTPHWHCHSSSEYDRLAGPSMTFSDSLRWTNTDTNTDKTI